MSKPPTHRPAAQPVTLTIGHVGTDVYVSFEQAAQWLRFTPEQARAIAQHLLVAAQEAVNPSCESTPPK